MMRVQNYSGSQIITKWQLPKVLIRLTTQSVSVIRTTVGRHFNWHRASRRCLGDSGASCALFTMLSQTAGVQPSSVVGWTAPAGNRCGNDSTSRVGPAAARLHAVHGACTRSMCSSDHCLPEAVLTSRPLQHTTAQSRYCTSFV